MIVVIGAVAGRSSDPTAVEPAGMTVGVAMAAAKDGGAVEIVTRLGDDATGDLILQGVAKAGVGHVATIRDAGHRTPVLYDSTDGADPGAEVQPTRTKDPGPASVPILDAADVELAMRYLGDYRVIVVMHPIDRGILSKASDAAAWAGAHLVTVLTPGDDLVGDLPAGALAITAGHDAEGVAALLGRYAAAVDRGEEPAAAYAAFTAAGA